MPEKNLQASEHLLQLNKEFPYALLTDDFGILNRDDLATNSCMGEPVPFAKRNLAFPYWQCFEVQNIKLICEDMGPYENSKERSALMKFKIHSNEKTAEYLNRRGIEMSECVSFRKTWQMKTQNQKYFCISGTFGFIDKTKEKLETEIWTFLKYKTKKGCESYFQGDCSLKYLSQQALVTPPKNKTALGCPKL
jgi:hypothetical protein